MHYHANPETFLVLSGKRRGQRIQGRGEADSKERSGLFRRQRLLPDHQYRNRALVLFGNRSEAFGGPHIKADGTDRKRTGRNSTCGSRRPSIDNGEGEWLILLSKLLS